jgi:hypothetical protein
MVATWVDINLSCGSCARGMEFLFIENAYLVLVPSKPGKGENELKLLPKLIWGKRLKRNECVSPFTLL